MTSPCLTVFTEKKSNNGTSVCVIPKVDKNWPKIPKIKTPSGIRRPGVGVRGWVQGGPKGLSY